MVNSSIYTGGIPRVYLARPLRTSGACTPFLTTRKGRATTTPITTGAQRQGNISPLSLTTKQRIHYDQFEKTSTGFKESPKTGGFKASGKTVVITGGSKGIGKAIAVLFAKKGYNVVVASRNLELLKSVVEECKRYAGREGACLAVQTDVTKEEDVDNLANQVIAKYDTVDVLINAAGSLLKATFEDTSLREMRHVLDVNFIGAVATTQSFLPVLQKSVVRRSGMERPSIVFVNSIASQLPVRSMPAYTAAKFALRGFVEAIKPDVTALGIHVSQVHPGFLKRSEAKVALSGGSHHPETSDAEGTARDVLVAPFLQSVDQIAEDVYAAACFHRQDIITGTGYAAAAAGYKNLGLNPFALNLV